MQMIRTIRALDGILYSLLALLALLLHPTVGRDPLGGIDLFCAIPAFTLAWFCLGLPAAMLAESKWQHGVHRLRLSALAFAGLAPFAVWWLRRPASNYLVVNFLLCALAGACVAFFLTVVCGQLSRELGRSHLAWESRLARGIVFWGLIVVGFGGITLVLLISLIFFKDHTPGRSLASFLGLAGRLRLGNQAHSRLPAIAAAFVAIAPVVFLVSLVVRLRFAVLAYLHENKEA